MEGVRSGGDCQFDVATGGCGRTFLPGAGAACFLGFAAAARGSTLSSESELGSSIRCRLAGFGYVGLEEVVVPLLSHGSVLAITVDAVERWR